MYKSLFAMGLRTISTCFVLLALVSCASDSNLRPHKKKQPVNPSTIAGSDEPSEKTQVRLSEQSTEQSDSSVSSEEKTESVNRSGFVSSNLPVVLQVSGSSEASDRMPIDLPTALKLGGANNLQIRYTRERLRQAEAQWDGAKGLWLPTLFWGTGYRKHDGRIQSFHGEIHEVSRNAGYVGLSPTNIMGGGPISTIDVTNAIYEPLAARQVVRARRFEVAKIMNDTLLKVAIAYGQLVKAKVQLEIAEQDLENASQLVSLTEEFAKVGQGLESDAARARDEQALRQRRVIEAAGIEKSKSVRLSYLLHLDPTVTVFATEEAPIPIELVSREESLNDLIERAQLIRPENEQQQAILTAADVRMRQESVRPFIPRMLADISAGGFGGGSGSHFGDFSGRTDLTVNAVWELRNFGFGNRALQRQRRAQYRQEEISATLIRDTIAAEVTDAYVRLQGRFRSISVAKKNVEESLQSLHLNMTRIRGGEGLPIEALQAIQSVAKARRAYLDAVIVYNKTQFELLRALGSPIGID